MTWSKSRAAYGSKPKNWRERERKRGRISTPISLFFSSVLRFGTISSPTYRGGQNTLPFLQLNSRPAKAFWSDSATSLTLSSTLIIASETTEIQGHCWRGHFTRSLPKFTQKRWKENMRYCSYLDEDQLHPAFGQACRIYGDLLLPGTQELRSMGLLRPNFMRDH